MGVVVGKDDSFATQSAYLRAANIERVAVLGQVRQRDVVVFRHETIAQSGAIYIERQVVTAAHLEDVVELLSGVKRTILGGKGDVHHARIDGVGGITVMKKVVEIDRKSTRLNSSHANISYAVFCLKKKNT